MWKILVFLLGGMMIGAKGNLSEKIRNYNGKLQVVGVMILLFTMGATIGLNKSLLNNVKNIGLKAFVFALLTSMMSIVIVYVVSRWMIKDKENIKNI
ncbi:MAG: lysine exporter LysO family protein [Marinisporobacter sp.]|jgi:Kef-type K+ transport system membrane component KefB|nr:lysine exporter LysO family protein [Marinisporobacter sp.]